MRNAQLGRRLWGVRSEGGSGSIMKWRWWSWVGGRDVDVASSASFRIFMVADSRRDGRERWRRRVHGGGSPVQSTRFPPSSCLPAFCDFVVFHRFFICIGFVLLDRDYGIDSSFWIPVSNSYLQRAFTLHNMVRVWCGVHLTNKLTLLIT